MQFLWLAAFSVIFEFSTWPFCRSCFFNHGFIQIRFVLFKVFVLFLLYKQQILFNTIEFQKMVFLKTQLFLLLRNLRNITTEAAARKCSVKKSVLEIFAKFIGKHLCQSIFFDKFAGLSLQLYWKNTLTQVLSYEFCEIFKNIFFDRTPLVATSDTKVKVLMKIFHVSWNALKLYFMKCSEKEVSQCIIALKIWNSQHLWTVAYWKKMNACVTFVDTQARSQGGEGGCVGGGGAPPNLNKSSLP